MIYIKPPDMTVPSPAKIGGPDTVGSKRPDRVRARQEIIVVEMKALGIAHMMNAELRGVALDKKILAVKVRDRNALVAAIETVQAAVCVLFEPMEKSNVVLIAVGF